MAIRINAANAWLQIPVPAAAMSTGSVTVVGRTRMSSNRGTWSFICSIMGGGLSNFLYANNGTTFKSGVNWASNDSTNQTITTLTAGDEIGFALVGSGTTLRCYIRKNGVTYFDDEVMAGIFDLDNIIIGSNFSDNFDGEFIDVKVYNVPKTQPQIEAEWAAAAVQNPAGLVCYGTLNQSNISGASLTNEISNFPWSASWTIGGSPIGTNYTYNYSGGSGGGIPLPPVLASPLVVGGGISIAAATYVAGATINVTINPGNLTQSFVAGQSATYSLTSGNYSVTATQTTSGGGTSASSAPLNFSVSNAAISINLVPFGDSLTAGSNSSNGQQEDSYVSHRGPLFSLLSNSGYSPTFYGPQSNLTRLGNTTNHAGFGGATIGPGTSSSNNLSTRVSLAQSVSGSANVVVMMAGANNFNSSTNNYGETAIAEYEVWLNAVLAAWPSAMIVLVVQPTAEYWAPGTIQLNNWSTLRSWLNSRAQSSSTDKIVVCDIADTFVSSDRTDGLHLSVAGAAKAANGIFNTIQSNLGLIGGSSVTLGENVDPPVLGTPAVSGNSITITATGYAAGATILATLSPSSRTVSFSGGQSGTFTGIEAGNYSINATQSLNNFTSSASSSVPASVTTVAIRLVPFGDSLTSGSFPVSGINEGTSISYRGPLFDQLQQYGYSPVFLGPVSNMSRNGLTSAHAGWNGASVGPGTDPSNNLSTRVSSVASVSTTANIIVMMAGANNMFSSTNGNGNTVIAEYTVWLDAVKAAWPNALIVLVVQPPDLAWTSGTAQLNNWTALRTFINAEASLSLTDKIVVCDIVANFTNADRYDGVHLNQAGADKLAQGIFNTITSNISLLLGTLLSGPPLTTGSAIAVSKSVKATIAQNFNSASTRAAAVRSLLGTNWRIRLIKAPNTILGTATSSSLIPLNANGTSLVIPVLPAIASASTTNADTLVTRIDTASGNDYIDIPTALTGKPGVLNSNLATNNPMTFGISGNQLHIDFEVSGGGDPGSTTLTLPTRAEMDSAINNWQQWRELYSTSPTSALIVAGSARDLSDTVDNSAVTAVGSKRSLGFNFMAFENFENAVDVTTLAINMKRNGHGYARFLQLDGFMSGGTNYSANGSTGINYYPARINTFRAFVKALSQQGIRYSMEWFYVANSWGTGSGFTGSWSAYTSLSYQINLNNPHAIASWKDAGDLFARLPNASAVGHTPITDPNCIFFGMGNESSINSALTGAGGYYLDNVSLGNRFAATDSAWQQWRTNNGLGYADLASNKGNYNFEQFVLDVTNASYTNLRNWLNTHSYPGRLITSANWYSFTMEALEHTEIGGAGDQHCYLELDDGGVSGNESHIANGFHRLGHWMTLMPYGKPAGSTEYGMCGPTSWQRELAATYAIAALNDISFIANFIDSDSSTSLAFSSIESNQYAGKARVGSQARIDPILKTAVEIGAFLFQRGDVQRSPQFVGLALRRGAGNNTWHNPNIYPLANVLALRSMPLGVTAGPAVVYDCIVQAGASQSGWSTAQFVNDLRTRGIIPPSNTTNVGAGIYESITGEILMNTNTRAFRVASPRSHLSIWDNYASALSTSFMVIEDSTSKSLLSVHDIGATAQPLGTSRKMIMYHLTEIRPTVNGSMGNFAFQYMAELDSPPYTQNSRGLYSFGHSFWGPQTVPVYMRGSKTIVRMNFPPGSVSIYRLDARGNRVGNIPHERLPSGWVRWVADNTSTNGLEQSTAYEAVII